MTRGDLVSAIRELASAATEGAGAIRDLAQALRSLPELLHVSDTVRQPDAAPWQDTDVAFARRTLRPLGPVTPEERIILERMSQQLRKTTPSPAPKK